MGKNIYMSNESNRLYDSIKRKIFQFTLPFTHVFMRHMQKRVNIAGLRLLALGRPPCKIGWYLGI